MNPGGPPARHPSFPHSESTYRDGRLRYIKVPQWFLVAMMTAVSFAPWIKWSDRFSLRTLLIATTLVAVLLWVTVYTAK